MKNLLSILLLIPYLIFSQECMPCEIIANPNMEITKVNSKWPDVKNKSIVKINSLTKIIYQDQDDYWERFKMRSWWMRDGHDPWTEDPVWGDGYKKPDLNFNSCVNDNYRWKCGYSYVLRLPENFKKNKRYPLVIFLHGGVNSDTRRLNGRIRTVNSFYIPKNDQYIIASPIKLGIDWSAKKIQDMIAEIYSQLKIDKKRVYLTGLSMGGRGTFIVASELSNTFAAIMPLSPHHTPYSYISLAEKVSHLPTFLHHSTNDKTSKFSVAEDMFSKLSKINDNIVFDIGNFGHSGWNKIYSNPKHIEWLLSWRK
ncbi:MAG: dienelactone hydrolase family protein [Bacteroidota bacterium]|nr:dienelactone hydrolase family protein [Bacteroidota bacterium]MEC8602274.1 dienelactone hydrolase family protein [Bacteroidota bacterium]